MNTKTIIPLYIYHYVDPYSENYYGIISYDKDLSSTLYQGWFLYGIVYVFSPFIKPLPDGTKLFNVKIKNYFPYDIKEYKLIYDIFSIDLEDEYSINFITYNRPVTNVKPLYFHQFNNSIFPSFDKNPPNTNPNWTLSGVNPIYVMTKENQKFYCDNGRCLPSPMLSNHFHQTGILGDDDNIEINDCLEKCKGGIGILQTVYDISHNKNEKKYNINLSKQNKTEDNIEIKNISLILGIILLLFLIIFFIINKR